MTRATPNDPLPDRTHMVQLVDLEKHSCNPFGEKETEYGDLCYFKLPLDFPGFMRLLRRIDQEKKGKSTNIDHLATTLEITMSDGRRIWIKSDRKTGAVTISTQAESDEKPSQIVKYKKEK